MSAAAQLAQRTTNPWGRGPPSGSTAATPPAHHAPSPALPRDVLLRTPGRARRPSRAGAHRKGPFHLGVPGSPAHGEVRPWPSAAPRRRRAQHRRAPRVSEGTLAGVIQTLSGHLGPIDALIRARNAASAHLHIDETSWKVFEAGASKEGYKWWLWVFLATYSAIVTTLFELAPAG
ncbi:MAG: IS66 family transposase [Acidimicrobiales bacterium]